MILSAILAGFIVLLGNTLLVYALLYKYRQEKQAAIALVKLYFASPDDKTPSEFAQLVQTVGGVFASQVLQAFKSSSMGSASVASKNESRAELALVQDAATQANPAIGMILNQFPQLAKLAMKNPAAQTLLANILNRGSNGENRVSPSSNQMKFGL